MRRVLLIHYHFLPVHNVAVKHLLGYARYLPAFGWQPLVLTHDWESLDGAGASWGLSWEPELEASLPIEIHRVRARRPLPLRRSGDGDAWLQRKIRSAAHLAAGSYPDAFSAWTRPAVARAVDLARQQRIDAVLTYCPPETNHVVGSRVARALDVPWVPFFGDLYGFFLAPLPSVSLSAMISRWYHRRWLNGSAYLPEAFDSILGQRYRPFEIIAIDDGSTDGTPEVLRRYGEVVRSVWQKNAGPAEARNAGVAIARGEFVAFLDQDDQWHPDKLERQMAHLAGGPRIDVSVACVENVWTRTPGSPPPRRAPDEPRGGTVPGYVTGTMLARRGAFDRVGRFQPEYRYADSLDWFARAAERGVVVGLLPDVLLYHRVHAGNLSRDGQASRAECLRIIRRAIDRRRAGRAPVR